MVHLVYHQLLLDLVINNVLRSVSKMKKQCSKCKEWKDISEYYKTKHGKYGVRGGCKQCSKKQSLEHKRDIMGYPMLENKECAQYLGIAIAERLVSHLFKDVQRMPPNNPGYDFICSKKMKIDIKSACITLNNKKNPRWIFKIGYNITADYFLLLAFNNRDDLELQHQWLVPEYAISVFETIAISEKTLPKWKAWEHPIDDALTCCNELKEL